MTVDYGAQLTITVERTRRQYRATTTIGTVTLEAVRPTAEQARAALIALYEDTLFGINNVNRRAARAWREKHQ